jgi:hypothetical protein
LGERSARRFVIEQPALPPDPHHTRARDSLELAESSTKRGEPLATLGEPLASMPDETFTRFASRRICTSDKHDVFANAFKNLLVGNSIFLCFATKNAHSVLEDGVSRVRARLSMK